MPGKGRAVSPQHYFAGLIEQRRESSGDYLVAAWVCGERPLEVPKILEVIGIFVAGGVESTVRFVRSATLFP